MRTTTRAAVALAAGALAMSLTTTAGTAAAIPPHAEDVAPLLAVFPDLDNGLVGYLNTTREEWCAWEAGGSAGAPPLLKDASPAWERVTGTGEVSGNARDELHLELWPLDADAELVSSCEDTSDATGPFATGRADVRAAELALEGDDGRGAWFGRLGFNADLTGTEGGRYRYHVYYMELVDAKGRVRLADSPHIRLTTLP